MNHKIFYHKVKIKSQISDKLLIYVKDNTTWKTGKDSENLYHDFEYLRSKTFIQDFVVKDKFLQKLYETFPFGVEFFKLQPFSSYDWHSDKIIRKVAVNLLLTKSKSNTLFSIDRNKMGKNLFTFVELKYKIGTYYLLNTEIEHTVFNFESERILMSLTFEDKSLSYMEVLEKVLEIEDSLVV